MNPAGEILPNQTIWQIQCTNLVRRPSVDAYIRFYSKFNTTQVYSINVRTSLNDVIYSNSTLIFFTLFQWNPVTFSFLLSLLNERFFFFTTLV